MSMNNLSTIIQLSAMDERGIPHIFNEDFIRWEQMKLHTINNQQSTLTINLNLEIRILAQNQQYFIVKTHDWIKITVAIYTIMGTAHKR